MTMNLSGTLSSFGLADVLSLLAMGRRTARMRLESGAVVGLVQLVDGEVTGATSDAARATLLRGVVAGLRVAAVDLADALESDQPLRALVDSGAVDRSAVQDAAVEHMTDAIGDMLGWTEGQFSVEVTTEDPGDLGVRRPVDSLISAARERLSDWERVRAELPPADSVLSLAPDLPQDLSLSQAEWSVLARVDGHRTLTEVLQAVGPAQLVASDRLVELLARGLVQVRTAAGAAGEEMVAQLVDAFEHGLAGAATAPSSPVAVAAATERTEGHRRPVAVPVATVPVVGASAPGHLAPVDALPPVDQVRAAVAQALGFGDAVGVTHRFDDAPASSLPSDAEHLVDVPGLADEVAEVPALAADVEAVPDLAHGAVGYEAVNVGFADDAPIYADDVPGFADDAPVYADDAPVYADEVPGFADEVPGFADEAPAYADEAPAYADEVPGFAEEVLVYADEVPAYADEVPGFAAELPTEPTWAMPVSRHAYAGDPVAEAPRADSDLLAHLIAGVRGL